MHMINDLYLPDTLYNRMGEHLFPTLTLKCYYDQIFTPCFFLLYHIVFHERIKILQISAFVLEIFKFESRGS